MVKQLIERLIDTHFCVMVEFLDGNVYHLVDHWKYLDFRDSQRELICQSVKPNTRLLDDKYLYLYSKEHLNTILNDKGGN